VPVSALTEAFDALQGGGFSALVWDPQFRVVGLTDEALKILRLGDEGLEPPLGRHMFSPEWVTLMENAQGGVTLECQRQIVARVAPALLEAEGGLRALRDTTDPRLHDLLDGVEPDAPPPLISVRTHVNFGDRTTPLDVLLMALRNRDGSVAGGVTISKPGVGGAMVAMLATGDPNLFERMLRSLEPARRACAVLFADLESSTPLGRRLSTHAYFALLRRLFWHADRSVVEAGGIVGSHVGDGLTAYFLSDDAGGDSQASRACIQTAAALREDAAVVAERSHLDPSDVMLRIGLHWSANAYIGRLLTSARTEITAMGDEVNECARIEACAAGGRTLASKALIERLDQADADDLGFDRHVIEYTALGDLPGAPEKARRDAPQLSVAELYAPSAMPA
jgi:class 3 adenylate cyclase